MEDGKLIIIKEGKKKKFRDHVEQVTFSGSYAAKINQPVLYITERAVFKLEKGEVTLVEIAPGIDLDNDIVAQMEFAPKISRSLKLMDSAMFQTNWGGLKDIIDGQKKYCLR